MIKIGSNFFLYLFLFTLQSAYAQELSMLDNVLAFTSQDEFIAHSIYKVVSQNYSENQSIDLIIEGDIKSYEYSLALISMLPAYAKFSNRKSISFKYSNLSEENVNEALLIEAIKSKYPKYLVEYLLTRAECLFELDGLEAAEQMNLDINYLKHCLASESNKQAIRSNSLTNSTETYKVLVNNIEFEMIPAFYIGFEEPSLYTINPDDNDCSFIDCISRGLDNRIQLGLREGLLNKSIFDECEFIYSQQDLYVSLISCASPTNHSPLNKIKYLLNPSGSLLNMIEDAGYRGLAKYFNPKMYENICRNRPCHYYNLALKKELERRKNIVPEPIIWPSCDGTGYIILSQNGFQGENPPYTFKWSNGGKYSSIRNLKYGFYQVTIQDAVGRQVIREYEVKNIWHPYAIEVVRSELDPSTKKYNIDIQMSCPKGNLNTWFQNVPRAGLTHNPENTYGDITFEPRTLHFSNVPPGENELFIDISGSTDTVDLTNECTIIRLGFYLEELE